MLVRLIMWALLYASIGGLALSGAAHASIIPRQDDSSIAAMVAQAVGDLNLQPATSKPTQVSLSTLLAAPTLTELRKLIKYLQLATLSLLVSVLMGSLIFAVDQSRVAGTTKRGHSNCRGSRLGQIST